ncbi:MAG TPA: methionyl-tRNA formyltransferase [Candidatus Obscuribacterales bacterium]
MRIIYLGTPEFAVPTLEKLISWPEAEVVGLVTQPDRPAGRGKHIFAPPTKIVAQQRNIAIMQPEKLSRSPDVVQQMRDLKPDILVMVAFGQILKKEVLEMAPMGVLNLHGSLLPKLRGAAPINWAIINGETITGNTTMFTEAGVDTGPMLLKQNVPIGPDTTAEDLAHTMSITGAQLVIDTLTQLKAGTLKPTRQDDSQATFAPRLEKEMGVIDWKKNSQDLHNWIRGLVPWPGTWTLHSGNVVKITQARAMLTDKPDKDRQPGTIVLDEDRVLVSCGGAGEELLELLEVQPANKSRMKARDWVNGAHIKSGTVLGS